MDLKALNNLRIYPCVVANLIMTLVGVSTDSYYLRDILRHVLLFVVALLCAPLHMRVSLCSDFNRNLVWHSQTMFVDVRGVTPGRF
jgi:hypothetical protein